MATTAKRLTLMAVCLILQSLVGTIWAERVGFEGLSDNVSLDLPEEFYVAQSMGQDAFLLECKIAPVKVVAKVIPLTSSPKEELTAAMRKLRVSCTIAGEDEGSALVRLSGTIEGKSSTGWATVAKDRQAGKGVLLIAWCPKGQQYEFLLESIIDSLCLSQGDFFAPGIFMRLTRPDCGERTPIKATIGGKTIESSIDRLAAESSEHLIEREYQLLLLYQNSSRWAQAWQRYYRMIFKDSCYRVRRFSLDVYFALAPKCADETDFAQQLLTWTQGMSYQRRKTTSDFASLPSMLLGEGSDCDARAMMIAAVLQNSNIDSCIFVSAHHAHALAGLASDHPGFSFDAGGKNYLVGETTVPGLTWGIIAQEQSDRSQWIQVLLP